MFFHQVGAGSPGFYKHYSIRNLSTFTFKTFSVLGQLLMSQLNLIKASTFVFNPAIASPMGESNGLPVISWTYWFIGFQGNGVSKSSNSAMVQLVPVIDL